MLKKFISKNPVENIFLRHSHLFTIMARTRKISKKFHFFAIDSEWFKMYFEPKSWPQKITAKKRSRTWSFLDRAPVYSKANGYAGATAPSGIASSFGEHVRILSRRDLNDGLK